VKFGDAKPPWTASNPREREWMRAWVNARLDDMDAAFDQKMADAASLVLKAYARPRSSAEERKRKLTIGKLIRAKTREWFEDRAAESDDVETLRRLNPRLFRFINLPPLKRGQHFKKKIDDMLSPQHRLKEALAELPRITAIWAKNYDGKKNRPQGQLTAAEIAAGRWSLTADEVRKRRLSRKRLKKP
jgi:hypothetical protein